MNEVLRLGNDVTQPCFPLRGHVFNIPFRQANRLAGKLHGDSGRNGDWGN